MSTPSSPMTFGQIFVLLFKINAAVLLLALLIAFAIAVPYGCVNSTIKANRKDKANAVELAKAKQDAYNTERQNAWEQMMANKRGK